MSDPKRIVHINTHDVAGGAAKVAWRLAEAQRKAGHDARMMVAHRIGRSGNVHVFFKAADPYLMGKCRDQGLLYYELQGSHQLVSRDEIRAADLLHLHNLHGDYFNPFSLPALTRSTPTVWTLHDMQALTGHCAHAFDCQKWQTGCHGCPRLDIEPAIPVDVAHRLWRHKADIYRHTIAGVVTPSAWLGDMAAKSILGHLPLTVIPNGIDTRRFRPGNARCVRQKLKIPQGGFVVGAVSHGGPLANQWKGGGYTRRILEAVWRAHPDLVFVCIGSGDQSDDPRIVHVPHIHDESELADVYGALDAFLYTPVADNCPLVILEALACGVPPVTFATGGIPELVSDGVSGMVLPQGDIAGMVNAVTHLKDHPDTCRNLGKAARSEAVARFDHDLIEQQYMVLYEALIRDHAAARRQCPVFTADMAPAVIRTEAFEQLVRQSLRDDSTIDAPTLRDTLPTPSTFSAFTYSKRWHFGVFKESMRRVYGGPVDPEKGDLKIYQDLLATTFILHNLPAGARILEVGGGDSRVLKALSDTYECWNVDKLEGLGSGPTAVAEAPYRLVRDYMGAFSGELPDGYFDLVFSISALEHTGEDADDHRRICEDIDRVLADGGYALHLFDVRLRGERSWTNGLLPFMYRRYDTFGDFEGLEAVDGDDQLYTMSRASYDRGWRHITRRSYEDFGRPASCNILWQKSPAAVADPTPVRQARAVPPIGLPRITIVTPSYNQAPYLEACIRSVLGQAYPNLEYIVMDGGSDDGSVAVIERFQGRLAHWESGPDGGQYPAVNAGFARGTGDVMGWLNADDMLHPGALWTVARVFMEHPDVDWITGRPTVWNAAGKVVTELSPPPRWSRTDYAAGRYGPPHIQQESTFWRRRLWDAAGGRLDTDFTLAADMDLWARFFRRTDLWTVDHRIGGFRVHGDQKTARQMTAYETEAGRIVERERRLAASAHPRPTDAPPVITVADMEQFMSDHKSPDTDDAAPAVTAETAAPLVSVIVSTYGTTPDFMTDCLTDLVSQTWVDRMEVIVVDAASPTGEGAVVKDFQARHAHIRYERTAERIGVYAAWNRAIRAARGRFVMPFSTNDRLRTDAVEIMARELETHDDVVMVYGDTYLTKEPHGTFDRHSRSGILSWPDYDYADLLMHNRVGPHPMWRRSVHETVGYFDETFEAAGDQEFFLRLGWGHQLRHIPTVTGLYLWHDDALSLKGETPLAENRRIRDFYFQRYAERTRRELGQSGVESGLTSIVVLTLNNLGDTRRCLESIRDHTGEPYELIVVDNGSTDGTPAWLASAAGWFPRFRLIENDTNLGFGRGNNQGMAVAKGEFVLLLNNDTVATAGWLSRLIDCARRSPRIGMVGPVSNQVAGPQKVSRVDYDTETLIGLDEFAADWADRHDSRSHPLFRPVGFCLLLKRAVVDRIGGFDERFGLGNFEDDDYCLRAAAAGFEGRIALDCFIHHFGSRTFAGEAIDYNALLEQNWQRFKEKWALAEDLSYGSYDIAGILRKGFDPEAHVFSLPDAAAVDDVEKQRKKVTAMEPLKKFETIPQQNEAVSPGDQYDLDRGMNHLQRGDADAAVATLVRALERTPEDKDLLKALAEVYYSRQHRIEDAVRCYVEILSIDPMDADALLMMGHICTGFERFEDAEHFYQRLLEAEPWHAEARKYLDAVRQRLAVSAPPPSPEERYAQARELAAAGDAAGACRVLERLVALDDGIAAVHNDLGVLYYGAGDTARAVVHYEKAAALDAGNALYRKNLADFYYVVQNRVTDALKIYTDLLAADPHDVETLLSMGHICTALERFDDARHFYDRVVEVEPWHADVRQHLGELDRIDEIVSAAADTRSPEALYDTAQQLAADGRYDDAVDTLAALVTHCPDHAAAHNDLGVLYYRRGDIERAQHHYEQAVGLAPSSSVFQKNLADFYAVAANRHEDALRIYVALLSDDPHDVEALMGTGHICNLLSRFDDAAHFFQRVLEVEPWHEDARKCLDDVHQGRQTMAR